MKVVEQILFRLAKIELVYPERLGGSEEVAWALASKAVEAQCIEHAISAFLLQALLRIRLRLLHHQAGALNGQKTEETQGASQ